MTADREITTERAPIAPIELQRHADGSQLVAIWPDGSRTTLSARALREACCCAHCTARRWRDEPLSIVEPIAIAALAPVGDYAVNLVFSDGHARGIFPWSMLHAVGDGTAGN